MALFLVDMLKQLTRAIPGVKGGIGEGDVSLYRFIKELSGEIQLGPELRIVFPKTEFILGFVELCAA